MKALKDLKEGTKFTYNDKKLMKLPDNVTLYKELRCNAIDVKTGTLYYINSNRIVK